MRRYGMVCLLLALLLVLPLAVSCSKQGEKPNTGNPAESITQGDGTETEPQPGEEDREPDIRFDTDGVPADFNLAVRQDRYDYLYCDDANTSDTVQYSVFQRNSAICDKYGVDIRLVEIADGKAGAEWVTKINAAGTGDMDLLWITGGHWNSRGCLLTCGRWRSWIWRSPGTIRAGTTT